MRITVLAENTARFGSKLLGEHGLSILVEDGKQKILFDTGQGMVLQHNASLLGVDLLEIDSVFLSHGHYDHTNGLPFLLQKNPGVLVRCHPACFGNKWSRSRDEYIGMPLRRDEIKKLVLSDKSERLGDKVFSTGEIPRVSGFEKPSKNLLLKTPKGTSPDPLLDDQALVLETSRGLVVLLGCCHAGVVNTLNRVKELSDKPVKTLVGGTHLKDSPRKHLEQTIDFLEQSGVEKVFPGHCTGFNASLELAKRFGRDCMPLSSGTILEF